MEKEELRKIMREKRNALSLDEIKKLSKCIAQQVLVHPLFRSAASIGIYLPIHNEVDAHEIISMALQQGKIVSSPKMDGNAFAHVKLSSLQEVEKGHYGNEPMGNEIIIPDLVFVPGLAFDLNGNRVGYGKGFYDRYLRTHKIPAIGLAFDFQLVEEIKKSKSDVAMDFIITETQCVEIEKE